MCRTCKVGDLAWVHILHSEKDAFRSSKKIYWSERICFELSIAGIVSGLLIHICITLAFNQETVTRDDEF